jgi:four helix bundle protein
MEQDSAKNNTFFRFEDLRVYHKALEYIDWVYNATMLFPGDQAQQLANRFNSTAQAIAFYIAEGSARNKSQFIYYLKMAKSSVRECVVITAMAEKQNLLTETSVEESRTQLMEMTKMIGALIGSLQKSNHRGRNKDAGKDYDEEDDEMMPADNYNVRKY